MIAAQREAATPNMAFSAHGGSYWAHYNYVEKTSLDLSLALFMLARNATVSAPDKKRASKLINLPPCLDQSSSSKTQRWVYF